MLKNVAGMCVNSQLQEMMWAIAEYLTWRKKKKGDSLQLVS